MKKLLLPALLASTSLFATSLFAADPVPVTVTIDPTKPTFKIPDDYAGLSYETQRIEPAADGFYYFRPDNAPLIAMFKTLGLKNLRIGGNTVDNLKVPIPTNADIDKLFGFAKAAGVKVIYSFRIRNGGDPAATATTAKYIADHYGDNLLCFSIGNEPDLFLHSWDSYKKAWMPNYDAINAVVPGAKYCGPSLTSNSAKYARDFASNLMPSGKILYITQHQYAGGAGGKQTDPAHGIDLLLSKDWPENNYQKYYTEFVPPLNGAPWRLEEANNFYNGGAKDISDTFASALWGMDYLYWYGSHGAQGVNFHSGDQVAAGQNSVECRYASFISSPQGYFAHPVAYGIKMFNLGSKGSFVPVTLNAGTVNMTAYAVLGNDRSLYVTLINKEHVYPAQAPATSAPAPGATDAASALANAPGAFSSPAPSGAPATIPAAPGTASDADVTLSVGPGFTSGKYMLLTAPAVNSKTGVTLGGNPINDNGSFTETWSALPSAPAGGQVHIKVPATSAILVKLTP